MLRRGSVAGLVFLLAACVEHPDAVDYGDPTATNTTTEVDGIVAYVASPRDGTSVTDPSTTVVVAAYARDGQPLRATMSTSATDARDAAPSGGSGTAARYSASLPLLPGLNSVSIELRTADGAHFRTLELVVPYDGDRPGVAFRVFSPGVDGTCAAPVAVSSGMVDGGSVCVRGRASSATGVIQSVTVGVQGGAAAPATLASDGSFTAQVAIPPDHVTHVVATATDRRNLVATATVDVVDDATPPVVTLSSPQGGPTLRTDEASITLTGTATDQNGIAQLRIQTSSGGSQTLPTTSPWTATIPLVPGDNQVTILATDPAGNVGTLPVTVVQNRVLTLAAPRKNQGGTSLLLDQSAMSMLLSDADQQSLTLASVPLRPAIVSALHQIRDPEINGVDTSTWGVADQNMHRLLDMSPDNADLKGSSVDQLLGIAAAIGLPPARVLAQLLDTTVTSTFVDLDTAADVIVDQLVGTHPNITKDPSGAPTMDVSMYDVFDDLHTLSARFGPVGSHPGFLSGPTESKILQPGFRMSLPVKSNLTQYDGVSAKLGDRSAFFSQAGGDALTLDFDSPAFGIVGLTDEPTVDLGIRITENPQFLGAGADRNAGPDSLRPGFFRGDSAAWTAPPWQIESIIEETAYRQYVEGFASTGYQRELVYDAGSIHKAAVLDWARGWVTITTAGGIGDPPAPQYIWDVLSETAQLRLHDGGLAEGMADLGFHLTQVSIGLTADDLIAKVKPSLKAQSSKLSSLIAGSSGLAAPQCDFYYVENDAGTGGYLFFRAPGDSAASYDYATPGFFADAALTQKVSSPSVPGTADSTHEKVVPTAGQRLFFADDTKTVYRLDVLSASTTGVTVRLAPGNSS